MGADACWVSSAPSIIDTDAAAVVPAQLLQHLAESLEIVLLLNIFGERVEHADPPHSGRLLRARRERPRCRAAEKRDKLAALHSITSSARASTKDGISSPITLALLRLITHSYLVGACTGRSPGFSPRRMRLTYPAAPRH